MSDPIRSPRRPTVLIVDADRRVRGSLSALLELEQDVTVVGVAGDAATAVELATLHSPDVVVLDPRLPDVDAGVALLAFLRARLPASRLVVCACSDLGEGSSSLAAADAVLSKGVDPGAFVASVLGRDWAVLSSTGTLVAVAQPKAPAPGEPPAADGAVFPGDETGVADAGVGAPAFARLPAGNAG
jgi:CheY-like chemotaxis protein